MPLAFTQEDFLVMNVWDIFNAYSVAFNVF